MKVKYRGCKFSDLSPIVQEFIITSRLCKYPEDVPWFIERWEFTFWDHEEYEVMAMETCTVRDKHVTIALLAIEDIPMGFPLDLFEITDSSLRTDWQVSYKRDEAGYLVINRITFPEWAHDDAFLGNLINENDHEYSVYMAKLEEYKVGFFSYRQYLNNEQETTKES